ncbi:hypothetical protein L1987_52837 [Smallanthus sonchifolius]|uniref:Uncharacterized protein n=1 Tax=Smallanthus sonchifolius TaxID=185202 RepID=A0ACB9EU96_9ASTR|nr:hypothetical protein L1987_52837 [Smallanthus sonchifolius]
MNCRSLRDGRRFRGEGSCEEVSIQFFILLILFHDLEFNISLLGLDSPIFVQISIQFLIFLYWVGFIAKNTQAWKELLGQATSN